MAETIRIEIPVSVQDNTGSALSSITKKLTNLEKAATKVNKIMMTGTKKSAMEKSLESLDRDLKSVRNIDIGVNDNASHTISAIEDSASRLAGSGVTMDIGASDNATAQIANVEDAAAALHGTEAAVELGADDNATEGINDVGDATAALDGTEANVELGAADNATEIISSVEDHASQYNGITANADLGAADNASEVIDSVIDKASAFDGSTFTATIEAVGSSQVASNAGSKISGKATGVAGAALGIAGMSVGIGAAIENYKGFESTMASVKAIAGATDEEFEQLTETAQHWGAVSKFTAEESAQGLVYMGMAGWDADEMMAGLPGIINLAAASGEDLGTTSDIVTDALSAFQMKASDATHFADVMAETSARANTNVGMMGESFKYVAPVAGAMGYSIEDTALALGLMANAGVKSSSAGTALRTSIANLAAPTDAMTAAMEQYGISLTKEDGSMKSFKEVMDNTRESLRGLAADEQTAAVKTIFGKNAMSGMLAIINTSAEEYESLADSINHADGSADEMSQTMLDSMEGSLVLLSSAWDGFQNNMGAKLAPFVRGFADTLTDMMPEATAMVDDFFADFTTSWDRMTQSEEWNNADFFGKVNLAWDTMIAEPFMEWVGSSGAQTIGEGVAKLFSNAFKILPGGEKAQLTDWLSAGVLAIGAEKIAGVTSSIFDLSGALTKMGESGSIFGTFTSGLGTALPIIAGGAAAFGLLVTAIEAYNQAQINNSIADHFGDIELTTEQIQNLSEAILDVPWVTNIEVGLGELKEVEKLRSDAEERLRDNDALEYSAKVGVKLSDDDKAVYLENATTFLDDVEQSISDSAGALSLTVKSLDLKTEDGVGFGELIDNLASQDITELTDLSEQYSSAVEDALSKGLTDVDANALVDELQAKIQEIQDRWSSAQEKASERMLEDKYTGLSGAELEGGTYQALIDENAERRQAKQETMEQSKEAYYTHLYANEDRYTGMGYNIDDLMDEYNDAVKYTDRIMLANSLDYEIASLNDAYGADIIRDWDGGDKAAQGTVFDQLKSGIVRDESGKVDWTQTDASWISNTMDTRLGEFYNTSADAGLNSLYQQMEPDMNEMTAIIDEYAELGKDVPKELMDQWNAGIELGAAAGSESAGMQMFANSLVENGEDELISAIQEGYVGSDELRQALTRAMLDPVEGAEEDVDEFKRRMENLENEAGEAAEDTAASVTGHTQSVIDALDQSGGSYQSTEAGVEVTLGESIYEDDGSLKQGVQDFADTYQLDTTEITAGATITLEAESVDTTLLDAAMEETQEEAQAAAEEAANVETTGTADVEMEPETNADELYSEVESEVQANFSSAIPVTASAQITIDWSIVNPSTSIAISSSGGASAESIGMTAVIAGGESANGRYVDSPFVSLIGEAGPEYVIPVGSDKRKRGLELWMAAGEDLGVTPYAEGGFAGNGITAGMVSEDEGEALSSEVGEIPTETAQITAGGNTFNVTVQPAFTIQTNNPEEVLETIKANMRTIADQMGNQLAQMMEETYENRPAI